MKRKEAIEFNEELKMFLEKQGVELGLGEGVGANLIDQYIEIYPDEEPIMGMLDLKDKGSVSIKPGNILVNQKAILDAGFNLWLSAEIPENLLNLIKLSFLAVAAIYKTMKIELDENESYIAAYLHTHQMYERGDEEGNFYTNFRSWYKQQTGDEMSLERLEKAFKNLLILKAIAIEDGEVRLKEKVWHNKLIE